MEWANEIESSGVSAIASLRRWHLGSRAMSDGRGSWGGNKLRVFGELDSDALQLTCGKRESSAKWGQDVGGAKLGRLPQGGHQGGVSVQNKEKKKRNLTLADIKAQRKVTRMNVVTSGYSTQKDEDQNSCGYQGAGTDEQLTFSGPHKACSNASSLSQLFLSAQDLIPKRQMWFLLGLSVWLLADRGQDIVT